MNEVQKITNRPTCYYRWESEYFYATLDWTHINHIPYTCTSETKLQSLQYQIIHQYFPNKTNLHKWNKEPDYNCNLCNKTDTLKHYFYDCEIVNIFWISLKDWFNNQFQCNFNIGPLDVLLGVTNYENSTIRKALNFLILFGKDYIKRCKYQNKNIAIIDYLNVTKERLTVEKLNYVINGKYEEFEQEWGALFYFTHLQ